MQNGIDVHAHFLPDFYVQRLEAAGRSRPDGIPGLPVWNEGGALKCMDQLGVRTSMLSISSPGVHWGNDEQARELARRVNVYGADLRGRYPDRFGQFASVPLPDVEGAIEETLFALGSLRADGIIVETNSNGVYLGDPVLEPLYAVLNERAAVVLIHPTSPVCSCSERIDGVLPGPIFEFFFETTRSVIDLIVAGVLERHSRIRFIVPHAGAALSILANRVEIGMRILAAAPQTMSPAPFRESLKRLHYDLAGAPVPELLGALLTVADTDRLHYGSDFPFTPAPACLRLAGLLRESSQLSAQLHDGMWRNNSCKLFPRLVDEQLDANAATCLPSSPAGN